MTNSMLTMILFVSAIRLRSRKVRKEIRGFKSNDYFSCANFRVACDNSHFGRERKSVKVRRFWSSGGSPFFTLFLIFWYTDSDV